MTISTRLTRLWQKAAPSASHQHSWGKRNASQISLQRAGRCRSTADTIDMKSDHFLDGSLIPGREPLHGARATSVELRTPVFETTAEQLSWWKAWTDHFDQKGWRDRLFLYLSDEPAAADYSEGDGAGAAPALRAESCRSATW